MAHYLKIIEKIYVKLFTLFLLTSCVNTLNGQEALDKISKEMCQCIEAAEYKNASETKPCYDILFVKHLDLISNYYNTDKLTIEQLNEFGNKIAVKTLNHCDYIKNTFPTGIFGEQREKQVNVKCEKLKSGNFYYLNERSNSKILDTTFVTITKNNYLEKMRNRTTYSHSKIIWKTKCKFDLIFEESNDPFKKEMLHKGQRLSYEIVANEEKSFFVELEWKGKIYQQEIFKMK